MKKMQLLLINPHIEDFSAYDHYCAPLGLYSIAASLAEHADIRYINALIPRPGSQPHGDGTRPFASLVIPRPACLGDIPRKFRRYGMSDEEFMARLHSISPGPDYILLTSGMTYWYSGIVHSLSLIRRVFPDIPVILGGIYASLLPHHARSLTGVDHVVSGQDRDRVMDRLSEILNIRLSPEYRDPLYALENNPGYFPLMSSRGCVFDCHYCASPLLSRFEQFSPSRLAPMVLDLHARTGITRFPFYDDALLVHADQHIDIFLEQIIQSGKALEFYTPNGLHVRFLNQKTARLMYRAGFKEVRFSLESNDPAFMEAQGLKTSVDEFSTALDYLTEAGFSTAQIRAYTLANVPGQDATSIKSTMEWIWSKGAVPQLAFYSPIPGTPDFLKAGNITDVKEPLFQNNTVYLYRSGFDLGYYQELRSLSNHYRRLAQTRAETAP